LRKIILFSMMAMILAACSTTQEEITASISTPTLPVMINKWGISMTHSGGIMGLLRHIEVNSTGDFTISDEITNQIKMGNLSQDDLSILGNLVKTIGPIEIDPLKSAACADCFEYKLEIQRDGRQFSVELNDVSLPDSGYEPLVTELRKIMEDVLR